LKKCQKEELLDESKINRMGYDYLMKHKKPNIAGAIFRANTLLFPNSANVYDSYAESLYLSKNLEEALTNYQKAADIAKANDNPNLDLFLKNLEKVKGEILDKR